MSRGNAESAWVAAIPCFDYGTLTSRRMKRLAVGLAMGTVSRTMMVRSPVAGTSGVLLTSTVSTVAQVLMSLHVFTAWSTPVGGGSVRT